MTRQIRIPARDGYSLGASVFDAPGSTKKCVIVAAATGVPQRFYRHYAAALAAAGFTAITFDYRGIGDSRPESLRGFDALARDWALLDMAGVIDWAVSNCRPASLYLVGHSIGGQLAGVMEDVEAVDAMITLSAQSGYWGIQGGEQKWLVGLHMYLTFPLLTAIFGYMPWSVFGAGEDLPKGVAHEWARWCRNPGYVLGDETMPLHRYESFRAPVLAYSIDDDKWGTPRAVDAMMTAYPAVERRHLVPAAFGLQSIGHVGYFRKTSHELWVEGFDWLNSI